MITVVSIGLFDMGSTRLIIQDNGTLTVDTDTDIGALKFGARALSTNGIKVESGGRLNVGQAGSQGRSIDFTSGIPSPNFVDADIATNLSGQFHWYATEIQCHIGVRTKGSIYIYEGNAKLINEGDIVNAGGIHPRFTIDEENEYTSIENLETVFFGVTILKTCYLLKDVSLENSRAGLIVGSAAPDDTWVEASGISFKDNVLDFGIASNQWMKIKNLEAGSDLIAVGSLVNWADNKGLLEIRQEINFSLTPNSGAKVYFKDTNWGVRLPEDSVGNNTDYTLDRDYTLTENGGSANYSTDGGILTAVYWRTVGGLRNESNMFDSRGIANDTSDVFTWLKVEYGQQPATSNIIMKGTSMVQKSIQSLPDLGVTETNKTLVGLYSGLSANYSNGYLNVTVSSTHTWNEVYDYIKYYESENPASVWNNEKSSFVTTSNKVSYTYKNLSILVNGTSLSATGQTLPTKPTILTGGFFEDTDGAVWNTAGVTYYASPITYTTLEGATPIVNVSLAHLDSTLTSKTYNLSLSLVDALLTNSSGTAKGYAVWKIDSTSYASQTLIAREYNYTFTSVPKTLTGTPITENILLTQNSFKSSSKSLVSAYSGISINYTAKNITLTADRTIQELYDYSTYYSALPINLPYDNPLSTSDGSTFLVESDWNITLNNARLVETSKTLTMQGSGQRILSSGSLFEHSLGARWNTAGSNFYASHILHTIKYSGNPISNAELAYFDSSENNQIYNLSLAKVTTLTSNSSGIVEGYAVWKINSTSHASQDVKVKQYGYSISTIPKTLSGSPISEDILMTADSFISDNNETNVSLYTKFNVQASNNKITINQNTTLTEIYDYLSYINTIQENIDDDEYMTTSDGNTFLSNFNIILNGSYIIPSSYQFLNFQAGKGYSATSLKGGTKNVGSNALNFTWIGTSNGTFYQLFTLDILVKDSFGNPLENVTVSVNDNFGMVVYQNTSSSGEITQAGLIYRDYNSSSTSPVEYGPQSLSLTKTDYLSYSGQLVMSSPQDLSFSLSSACDADANYAYALSYPMSYDSVNDRITIWGSNGTDGKTAIGNSTSPISFENVYEYGRAVRGSCAVTKPAEGSYAILSKLDIGNVTSLLNKTYIKSSGQAIDFGKQVRINSNGTLIAGEKTSLNNPYSGSTLSFSGTDATNDGEGELYMLSGSYLELYDSMLTHKTAKQDANPWKFNIYGTVIAKRSSIENLWFFLMHYGRELDLEDVVFTNMGRGMYVHDSATGLQNIVVRKIDDAGVFLNNGVNITVTILAVSESTHDIKVENYTGTTNLVDSELNWSKINWSEYSGTAFKGKINRMNSLNLKTTDSTGSPIANATVTLTDINGVTVFIVNTSSEGQIVEQTVTTVMYNYTYQTGLTKNPHQLTITHPDYQTYTQQMDIAAPVDFSLALSNPCDADPSYNYALVYPMNYTSSKDTLTIIGNSTFGTESNPITFEQMYEFAKATKGTCIIDKPATGTYSIKSQLDIGNGTQSVYVDSKGESLSFSSSNMPQLFINNSAHISFGSVANNIPQEGCSIKFTSINLSDILLEVAGELSLYDSYVTDSGSSWGKFVYRGQAGTGNNYANPSSIITIKKTTFDRASEGQYLYSANVTMDDVKINRINSFASSGYGLVSACPCPSLTNIQIYHQENNGSAIKTIAEMPNNTILTLYNSEFGYNNKDVIAYEEGRSVALVNTLWDRSYDFNWTGNWNGTTFIKESYGYLPNYVDSASASLENITIVMLDNFGDIVLSAKSNVSGTIAEQYINTWKVEKTNISEKETSYNPFTLYSKKYLKSFVTESKTFSSRTLETKQISANDFATKSEVQVLALSGLTYIEPAKVSYGSEINTTASTTMQLANYPVDKCQYFAIFANGTRLAETTDYSLNSATGLVTFVSSKAGYEIKPSYYYGGNLTVSNGFTFTSAYTMNDIYDYMQYKTSLNNLTADLTTVDGATYNFCIDFIIGNATSAGSVSDSDAELTFESGYDISLGYPESYIDLAGIYSGGSSSGNPEVLVDAPAIININTNFDIAALAKSSTGVPVNCSSTPTITIRNTLNDTNVVLNALMSGFSLGQYKYTWNTSVQSTYLATITCPISGTDYLGTKLFSTQNVSGTSGGSTGSAYPTIEMQASSPILTSTSAGIVALVKNSNGVVSNCDSALGISITNLLSGTVVNTGTMTNSGTGIYNYSWTTPASAGIYYINSSCSISSTSYSGFTLISTQAVSATASIDYNQIAQYVWNYTSRNLTYYNQSVAESLQNCLKDGVCSNWWINNTFAGISSSINILNTTLNSVKSETSLLVSNMNCSSANTVCTLLNSILANSTDIQSRVYSLNTSQLPLVLSNLNNIYTDTQYISNNMLTTSSLVELNNSLWNLRNNIVNQSLFEKNITQLYNILQAVNISILNNSQSLQSIALNISYIKDNMATSLQAQNITNNTAWIINNVATASQIQSNFTETLARLLGINSTINNLYSNLNAINISLANQIKNLSINVSWLVNNIPTDAEMQSNFTSTLNMLNAINLTSVQTLSYLYNNINKTLVGMNTTLIYTYNGLLNGTFGGSVSQNNITAILNSITNVQTNLTYIRNNMFYQGNATGSLILDYLASVSVQPASRAELFISTRDLLGNSKTPSSANCNILHRGIFESNATTSISAGGVYAFWNVSVSQATGDYYWNCSIDSDTNLRIPFFVAAAGAGGSGILFQISSLTAGSPRYPNEEALIESSFSGSTGSAVVPDSINITIYDKNDNVWAEATKADMSVGTDNIWKYAKSIESNPTTGMYTVHLHAIYNGIEDSRSVQFRIATGGPYLVYLDCPSTATLGTNLDCVVTIKDEGEAPTESISTVWLDSNDNSLVDTGESQLTFSKLTTPQQNVTWTAPLNIPASHAVGIFKVRVETSYVNSAQPNSRAVDTLTISSTGGVVQPPAGGGGGGGGSITGEAIVPIVCNKPYIRYGSDCCIDSNDNTICDSDEQPKAPEVIEEIPKIVEPTNYPTLENLFSEIWDFIKKEKIDLILASLLLLAIIIIFVLYKRRRKILDMNRLSNTIGIKVYDSGGNTLGEVKEVYLNKNNTRIDSWLIELIKELAEKVGKKQILVPQHYVHSIREVMIVDNFISEHLESGDFQKSISFHDRLHELEKFLLHEKRIISYSDNDELNEKIKNLETLISRGEVSIKSGNITEAEKVYEQLRKDYHLDLDRDKKLLERILILYGEILHFSSIEKA